MACGQVLVRRSRQTRIFSRTHSVSEMSSEQRSSMNLPRHKSMLVEDFGEYCPTFIRGVQRGPVVLEDHLYSTKVGALSAGRERTESRCTILVNQSVNARSFPLGAARESKDTHRNLLRACDSC